MIHSFANTSISMSDPSKTPLEPAPPGQVTNLIDPPDVAYLPRTGIYVMGAFTSLFLVLRLGARVRMGQKLGLDDGMWMTTNPFASIEGK